VRSVINFTFIVPVASLVTGTISVFKIAFNIKMAFLTLIDIIGTQQYKVFFVSLQPQRPPYMKD
jgi:hypothetical protein